MHGHAPKLLHAVGLVLEDHPARVLRDLIYFPPLAANEDLREALVGVKGVDHAGVGQLRYILDVHDVVRPQLGELAAPDDNKAVLTAADHAHPSPTYAVDSSLVTAHCGPNLVLSGISLGPRVKMPTRRSCDDDALSLPLHHHSAHERLNLLPMAELASAAMQSVARFKFNELGPLDAADHQGEVLLPTKHDEHHLGPVPALSRNPMPVVPLAV
mmetsp:Transcript_7388/g.15337  ORF Transcript_7388/g.15337 Transcript_7388/m.15337 type:complete len:214 (-) Transcript_7388:637-1278(-)